MTLGEKQKILRGRKIVKVEWNRFNSGRRGSMKWVTDPVFVLDNGVRVYFSVEETEIGEYGVSVNLSLKMT